MDARITEDIARDAADLFTALDGKFPPGVSRSCLMELVKAVMPQIAAEEIAALRMAHD